jgi:hypothetical protein
MIPAERVLMPQSYSVSLWFAECNEWRGCPQAVSRRSHRTRNKNKQTSRNLRLAECPLLGVTYVHARPRYTSYGQVGSHVGPLGYTIHVGVEQCVAVPAAFWTKTVVRAHTRSAQPACTSTSVCFLHQTPKASAHVQRYPCARKKK